MPMGFGVEATVLWDRRKPLEQREQHTCVGLTCGCYAKFHRQVAHIVDSRMGAGAAV